MRSPIRTLFLLVLSLLFWSWGGPVTAAEIQAELSRNPVALNESFQLTLSSAEEVSGEPDLSPLEADFELLNQGKNQSIQIINGAMNRSTKWELTLMAKRAGNLRIPAISFGSDQSDPLPIKVVEPIDDPGSAQGEELFLQVEAEPKSPYLQQQVLLKVRLFHAVGIGDATLSPPEVDQPETVVKKLGQDQQFQTTRNGRQYQVVERRYALFPQKSGPLTVNPFVFRGELLSGRNTGIPGFPMFNRGSGQIRQLRSDPIALDVRPLPPSAAQGAWLPSSNLQLVEDWPDKGPEVRVGEPFTRTLLIVADGLTSAQLPPLEPGLPDELKQYPDQPQLEDREGEDGVTGIRQQKIAIVPTRPGDYALPGVELTWWNTEQGRPETARLPERHLHVLPAAGTPAAPSAPTAALPQPVAPATPTTDGTPPPAPVAAPATPATPTIAPGLWPWLALFLGAGWLATAIAWWLTRTNPASSAPPTSLSKPPEPPRPRPSELKEACRSGDPARAAAALLQWANAQWPGDPPRSLGVVAKRVDPSLAEQITTLEQALYAPQPGTWDGDALWQQLRRFAPESDDTGQTRGPISPLNP